MTTEIFQKNILLRAKTQVVFSFCFKVSNLNSIEKNKCKFKFKKKKRNINFISYSHNNQI